MKDSRTTLSGLTSRNVRTDGASTLKVVALYDGFIAAVYAHEAVGSLALAVRPFMNVENNMWGFEMLTRLDLRHPSIRVAAQADVIIVAAEASSGLPFHVKSWLTRSLQENGKGVPLIVAIDQEGCEQAEATPSLHADLGSIAGRWGAPLLRNGEFDSRLERGLATELAGRVGNGGSAVDLSGLLSTHPAGSWGINE